MNKKQKDFVERFVDGTIAYAQEAADCYSWYGFDYIDELENELSDEKISFSEEEKQEMMKYIQNKLEEEYGYDNVWYNGSSEQTMPIDGRIQTIHYQLVIRF
ncbi:hypothetical protein COL32_14510 [Bacillus pseudomycoides]|uniref:hypothetical protein n=1 Tax=Bacillus pseudomycoides TaxID=64104 RepID=UPI000BF6888C|nr:hypothetical protein [Bacillus pseudomycoides]PFW93920.1 hypothetical protein COL29_12340 [Bacillus pseudomycoides]PFX43537.1 hypothetical protein COL32_14510 [Bacillus pseudomycoides]